MKVSEEALKLWQKALNLLKAESLSDTHFKAFLALQEQLRHAISNSLYEQGLDPSSPKKIQEYLKTIHQNNSQEIQAFLNAAHKNTAIQTTLPQEILEIQGTNNEIPDNATEEEEYLAQAENALSRKKAQLINITVIDLLPADAVNAQPKKYKTTLTQSQKSILHSFLKNNVKITTPADGALVTDNMAELAQTNLRGIIQRQQMKRTQYFENARFWNALPFFFSALKQWNDQKLNLVSDKINLLEELSGQIKVLHKNKFLGARTLTVMLQTMQQHRTVNTHCDWSMSLFRPLLGTRTATEIHNTLNSMKRLCH